MRIKQRQLFFFLACVAPVGKIVLMPSQLVYIAKNDLLFPAIANFLVQAAVIFLVLLLAKREQTIFELLQNAVGKVAASVLTCIFCAFLCYAAFLPLNEQKLMVQSVFYDTLPSLVVFAPYFVFAVYLCTKPLRSLGRVWDMLAPIAIVSYVGIILFSLNGADFGALSPVGAAGVGAIAKSSTSVLAWFFDSALVLSLVGKIEYKKGLAWKGLLCYLAGAATVVLFLAVFYSVFAETAIDQLFAFSKVSKYFAGISVLGRIDYLFIFSLALVMAFYTAMPVQASVDLLTDTFCKNKLFKGILSVVLNGILLLLIFLFDYKFQSIMTAIAGKLFWIFPIFTVAVPLLALLLLLQRRKNYE